MCLDVTHDRHVGISIARPVKLDRQGLSIEENELMAL